MKKPLQVTNPDDTGCLARISKIFREIDPDWVANATQPTPEEWAALCEELGPQPTHLAPERTQ